MGRPRRDAGAPLLLAATVDGHAFREAANQSLLPPSLSSNRKNSTEMGRPRRVRGCPFSLSGDFERARL